MTKCSTLDIILERCARNFGSFWKNKWMIGNFVPMILKYHLSKICCIFNMQEKNTDELMQAGHWPFIV